MRCIGCVYKEYKSDETTESGLTAQYKDTIIEDAYWQIFINDSARLTLCRNALLVRRTEAYFFSVLYLLVYAPKIIF